MTTIYTNCVLLQGDLHESLTDVDTLGVYDDDMTSEEVGRRLRAIRLSEPKITLEQLAIETGNKLTKSRISNYEQGLRELKTRQAQILAEAFTRVGKTVTASQLLMLEPYPALIQPTGSYADISRERLQKALAAVFELLPPDRHPIPEKALSDIIETVYNMMDEAGNIPSAKLIYLVRKVKRKYDSSAPHGRRLKGRASGTNS